MRTAAGLALASSLDRIRQAQCDDMGSRLSAISGSVVGAARQIHEADPTATPYEAPLTFTKVFTIIDALSDGDVRGKTLLDIGCGGGGFMAQALRLGMVPTGVDIYSGQAHSRSVAERLLEAAGMSPAETAASVRHADIASLPKELHSRFDFAVSLGMLEHIPDEHSRVAAVQHMILALKPGGTLILECAPNVRLPVDLFHFGPRYPFYHLLPDAIKRPYMQRLIRPRRPDLNEVQRDPRFLNGVSVGEIQTAVYDVDPAAGVVQAFPVVTRLAVSRTWLRRRSARASVGVISRLLVRLKMEPLIVIVARRSGARPMTL